MATKEQEIAICKTIIQTWDEEKTTTEPKGDRIFVRWVDLEERSWNDWELMATFKEQWFMLAKWDNKEPFPFVYEIFNAIDKDVHFGRIQIADDCVLWWCRSKLDGPPEPRITDWIQ